MKKCEVLICGKDYGCGKWMCAQHISKKRIGTKCNPCSDRDGDIQYACLDCEARASRCTKIRCWTIIVAILVVLGICFWVGHNSDPCEENNNTYRDYC